MHNYKFDYLIFIGRFQPFHVGHVDVVKAALKLAERVIIVMGSADQPRTPKNPFTAGERSAMIIGGDDFGSDINRIKIGKVRDSMYNDQRWTTDVQNAVEQHMSWHDKPRIGITGHHKDESSFYLDLFPQWKLVEHTTNEMVHATDLRQLFFEEKNLKFLQTLVTPYVFNFLVQFSKTKHFQYLVNEYNLIRSYKDSWKAAPYPPTFVTVDAIVVQSGHILLVQRGAAPGEGQWALPGGFIGAKEWIVDSMVRELREETKLKVPAPVLKGSIKSQHTFDHPNRSQRGRTITHAFHIELPAGPLPAVKGSDDAKNAAWFPINKIYHQWDKLFEDHGDIISYFVGV